MTHDPARNLTATPLTVRFLGLEQDSECDTLRLGLEIRGEEQEVFYRVRGAKVVPDPDAWAALALPLAMRIGAPLRLADPISSPVAESLRVFMDIYACWHPDVMSVVPLEFDARAPAPASQAAGVGSFFSGGVDSFFSVRKHHATLTHLIFVHGFDIPLANRIHRDRVSAVIRSAVADLGKSLIEVETNIREVTDAYLLWGHQYCSVPMAPIPLLLSETLHACHIPSDFSYAELAPWGSHVLTTPLLSSAAVCLKHTGAAAARPERIRVLSDDPLAQKYLRVCWQNIQGAYNCGRCPKCMYAMSWLRILGRLDCFSTFPSEMDLDRLTRLDWSYVFSWDPVLARVQADGTDPELERALILMRERSARKRQLRRMLDRLPRKFREWGRAQWHRLRPPAG